MVAAEEVAAEGGDVGGGEAEAVVTGVGGGEGEFTRAAAALVDDAVVIVEDFVDGYGDALIRMCEWWERVEESGGTFTMSGFSVYIRCSLDHIWAL